MRSRYPRDGHPIAPTLLADLLWPRVPRRLLREGSLTLADLDRTIWDRYDARTCRRLADAVVDRVRSLAQGFSWEILSRRLPALPPDMTLDDLDLEVRTFNALARASFLEDPTKMGRSTIGDLMRIRNFGAKSLVDILCSLEAVGARVADDVASPDAKPDRTIALDAALTSAGRELSDHPDANLISLSDPRFGDWELGESFPRAKTLAEVGSLIAGRRFDPPDTAEIADRVRRLTKAVGEAGALPLEEELLMILRSVARRPEKADVVARRLGFDGRGGATLEEVGNEVGVTRERVRQISSKVEEQVREVPEIYAPVLDQALSLVSKAPIQAGSLETALRQEGVTKGLFKLRGIKNAADLLRREIPFKLEVIAGVLMVLPEGATPVFATMAKIAEKATRSAGASTVQEVVDRLQQEEEAEVRPEEVASFITQSPNFEWLDRDSGWFWIPAGDSRRNPLVNDIRKIVSAAGRVHVAELRTGVGRHHRRHGFAPPRRVLLEICRQAPEFRVEGDEVLANGTLDWREVLAENEETLVEILLANEGVMTREALESEWVARGKSRASFYIHIGYSPVIVRHARGVYGVRGLPLPPGKVEDIQPLIKRKGRVLVDFGWLEKGRVWLGYRLSDAMVASGVGSIPSGFQEVLEGDFAIQDEEGDSFGTLRVKGTTGWGLSPLFRRTGAEAGDYLVLVLELQSREAVFELGEEEILESARSGGSEGSGFRRA